MTSYPQMYMIFHTPVICLKFYGIFYHCSQSYEITKSGVIRWYLDAGKEWTFQMDIDDILIVAYM